MSGPEILLKGALLMGGLAVILKLIATRSALPAPTTRLEARVRSGMSLQLYGIGTMFLAAFLFILSLAQSWEWLNPILYGIGIVGVVTFCVGRVRQREAEMKQ